MAPDRRRDFVLDICGVLLLLPLAVIPLATSGALFTSLTYQVAIGVAATMGVYVMLRLGLLSFTVPSFMALGGYASAMLSKSGTTDLIALMSIAFVVPAFVAVPMSALVLRLKGISFIFITFIFNEILQLLFFETPSLTGGANGIAGVPPATFFKHNINSDARLALLTVGVCILASLVTLLVTHRFRVEFTAIEENETLAESLGVVIWKYRTIGYVASAGVSGLAGFAVVNMLSTAHPSSFDSWSVNSYIAYAFVGGRGTMLGIVIGSFLLVVMTNIFSGYANLSTGMYGVFLIVALLIAPDGLVGTGVRFLESRRRHLAARFRSGPLGAIRMTVVEAGTSSGSSSALRVERASKSFGGHRVFEEISLEVCLGSILGVIGPNGAGKTTLINVMCGMLPASSGRILMGERDITQMPLHTVSRLGVVRSFQQTNTFRSVSVEENLFRALRFGRVRDGSDLRLRELLEEFGLMPHLHEPSDKLPYGLQKMLGLIMVLTARPKFLLLDEPAAGLEQRERTQVDRFVKHACDTLGCGILIVEHDMKLVRRLCPQIVVLESGRLLASGTPADVLSRPEVIDAYLGSSEE